MSTGRKEFEREMEMRKKASPETERNINICTYSESTLNITLYIVNSTNELSRISGSKKQEETLAYLS